jgi:hypothetical protein
MVSRAKRLRRAHGAKPTSLKRPFARGLIGSATRLWAPALSASGATLPNCGLLTPGGEIGDKQLFALK